jgi:hypothetical protein
VLVTLLCEGQLVSVLQLPVTHSVAPPEPAAETAPTTRRQPVG